MGDEKKKYDLKGLTHGRRYNNANLNKPANAVDAFKEGGKQ